MAAAAQPRLRERVMQGVRSYLWLGPVVLALILAVWADTRAQPSGEEPLVSAAQKTLSDALRGSDKSVARRMLSLQFTFVDADGKVFPRKEFLSDLKSLALTEAASDVKVSVYGLVGMVTGSRKSAQGGAVSFLDIWAKQKGTWRALTMQDVALGAGDTQVAAVAIASDGASKALTLPPDAKPSPCKNPCEAIPYRVRSPAEQDVIATVQELARADVAHNADDWAKHVADDFVLYRTGQPPQTKADVVAAMERGKTSGAGAPASEIQTMRLSVYGDGAAMIANYVTPNGPRRPYRAASVLAKRNGQWQLVIEVETDANTKG